MKTIAVLMGGTSNEREVSLVSGKNVYEALCSLDKYNVVKVVLDENNLKALPAGVDAVFLALHGGYGENGGVQADLNALKIPYTGPGAKASRIAMDKIETKRVLDAAGVPNARWFTVRKGEPVPENTLGWPVVVKAPRDGSSVGVYLVRKPEDFAKAVADAIEVDGNEALVEEFISGREMTAGVLAGKPLPVVEICAAGGWYGYEEKYNSNETRYPFLENEHELEAKLQQLALDAFNACGCRGVTRVDFRVSTDGKPYVLELNTLPGMTGHSLVPKAAARTGLDFAHMCDAILSTAACD